MGHRNRGPSRPLQWRKHQRGGQKGREGGTLGRTRAALGVALFGQNVFRLTGAPHLRKYPIRHALSIGNRLVFLFFLIHTYVGHGIVYRVVHSLFLKVGD